MSYLYGSGSLLLLVKSCYKPEIVSAFVLWSSRFVVPYKFPSLVEMSPSSSFRDHRDTYGRARASGSLGPRPSSSCPMQMGISIGDSKGRNVHRVSRWVDAHFRLPNLSSLALLVIPGLPAQFWIIFFTSHWKFELHFTLFFQKVRKLKI